METDSIVTCEAAECFHAVFHRTCVFRASHVQDANPDPEAGLKFWKLMRPLLEEFDHATASWGGTWVQTLAEIYESENIEEACPEYDANGRMIEPNHFMLQVFRIPVKEQLTLRKLCQVALNLGQLSAHKDCFTARLSEIFDMMMARTRASDYSTQLLDISPPFGTAKAICSAIEGR
eukprot:gnl/TRDRNA2_/TRDRNA2_201667_c0_seq1.p1 gnl/TRDRNA2_/TRDRNA2_201667_c0~~gnl/TRDRNA2_/TRDRNA2_201667_c0_seq1.p1  ORF type:complete len:177 (+),score=17.26 gnl/TRDRNA2_/TRDRNA2_201667_c0_seq1:34-564(+)